MRRKGGRPKLPPGQGRIQIHVSVSPEQKMKFVRLGESKWLQMMIDKAELPKEFHETTNQSRVAG